MYVLFHCQNLSCHYWLQSSRNKLKNKSFFNSTNKISLSSIDIRKRKKNTNFILPTHFSMSFLDINIDFSFAKEMVQINKKNRHQILQDQTISWVFIFSKILSDSDSDYKMPAKILQDSNINKYIRLDCTILIWSYQFI